MIRNASFQRKVIYLAAMIPILAALAYLGQPATGKLGDPNHRQGGKLARLRTANDLSQASLGEIDPAGETMKLATLGLRPAAASILWEKANEYKKKELWDALSATLNQITKLQPNFVTVWEFQAHNLSYNISVEFDDYRQRYHWVKKGIDFLIVGQQYNKREPKIPWNVGWFTGQKIGRADERVQFRRLFRDDEDFHDVLGQHVAIDSAEALGADSLHPDNWKVGRLWYLLAVDITEKSNARTSDYYDVWRRSSSGEMEADRQKQRSPLIFHADPAMALINYASTIQEEGSVGEVSQTAWQQAGKSWNEFGHRPIKSSWGHSLQLYSAEENVEKIARWLEELDSLAPGVRKKLRDERVAKLTSQQQSLVDLSEAEAQRQQVDYQAYGEAQEKTKVDHAEVAELADDAKRAKARRLAVQIADAQLLVQRVRQYRQTVNYDYWKTRCEAESSDESIRARRHVYEAQQLFRGTVFEEAKKEYEAGWEEWAKVFDAHPSLMEGVAAGDLMAPIKEYRDLLGQMGEPFPTDFKLQKLLDLKEKKMTPSPPKPDAPKPDAEKPDAEKSEPAKPAATDPEGATRGRGDSGTRGNRA